MGITTNAFQIIDELKEGPEKKWILSKLDRYRKNATRKPTHRQTSGRGVVSLITLKRKIDVLWSKYIRNRDSDRFGFASCVTCGRRDRIDNMDCGHYMSRGFMATRWDEKNCAAQCRKCNRYQEGRHGAFAQAINTRYGPGTAEAIEYKAKRGGNRVNRVVAEMILRELTQKTQELAKEVEKFS